MFENPGDELYFGEVYRQILQEAWLPGGGEVWSIIGKSRRGRRPSLRGITGPNVTPSQTEVRLCFSKCAAAWNALPWEIPPPAFCDNRQPKKYWKDEKDARGLMCSYYDVYMRYCLRFCLDTDFIPPANYLLKVEGDLSSIQCNKVYDLNFPNKRGDVSFVSGEGQFVSPGEWVSPKTGTEGNLCFSDSNGSFGSIPYSFDPFITEMIYDPDNPDTIEPNSSVSLSVLGGGPDFSWSVEGTGFWFDAEYTITTILTSGRTATLYADDTASGTAAITITDACGFEVNGQVECSDECVDIEDIAYDYENSDEEIDRESTATIFVTDGLGPFTWEVSGTGFWLDAEHTLTQIEIEGRTTTLYADNTACGSAAITVTGQCGTCTGYVRATEGDWFLKSSGECVISGSDTWYDFDVYGGAYYYYFWLVSGHGAQWQVTVSTPPGLHAEDCGDVPAICTAFNASKCPDGYDNCIDGDFAAWFPWACLPEEDNYYGCFCVSELEYWEWECES